METSLEARDRAEIDGEEIEEQRALVIRGDRDQASASLGRQPVVQALEVGGLSAQPRAVVDDLEVDFARPMVDEGHEVPVRSLGDRSKERMSTRG
jgi:hypothetical protein